ncbi:predicted protein [Nematostella vectensis]|uniref:Hexosyltransferase n=1 Tax=Nematostella vectensis TaxID=45351 RepID=A7T0C9_NEMVE|nr:predicted protein [Nematostella vectensis]|eukprot:XP_001622687.1 predicted protein [Nematostella vectensis]
MTSRLHWVLLLLALSALSLLYYLNLTCASWGRRDQIVSVSSRNMDHSDATSHSKSVTRYLTKAAPSVTQRDRTTLVTYNATRVATTTFNPYVIPTGTNYRAPGHQVRHAITFTPCLRDVFSDVLLLIVFNYPYYESIKLFKSFYQPVFPHIIFCGPPDSSNKHVMNVEIFRGVLGYECLGRAIREHPGYAGYLYINDDVILNYWNLVGFNKSQIWQSPNSFSSTPMYGEIEGPWYWWRSPYGLPNCRRAYEQLSNLTLGHDLSTGHLRENSNGSLRCFSGRSDVLYIPKRHASAFSLLSFIFYTNKVFLEIAVPTILRVIEREDQISHLPGYYISGDVRKGDVRVTDSRFFWFIYFNKKHVWFIHPFKLHHGKIDRNFNVVMLKHFLIEKTKSLTNCSKT